MSQHLSTIDHHFLSQQYDSYDQFNKENLYDEVNRMIGIYKSQNELKKKSSLPQNRLSPKKLIYNLLYKTNAKNKNKVSLSQNIGQKALKKSPLSIKQKSLPQQPQQISYLQVKKAQFFDYQFSKNNQSLQATNYKSLSEDICTQSDENDCENENQYKIAKLTKFKDSINSLLTECSNILQVAQNDNYQNNLKNIHNQIEGMIQQIQKNNLKCQKNDNQQEQLQNIIDIQKDLQCIQLDIFENQQNIVTCMQIQPFRYIMQKYKEKLKSFVDTVNQSELLKQQQKLDEKLKQLNKIKTLMNNLIKQEDNEEIIHSQDQQSSRRKIKNTNVVVSFENKELFLAAAQNEKGYLLDSPNFIRD